MNDYELTVREPVILILHKVSNIAKKGWHREEKYKFNEADKVLAIHLLNVDNNMCVLHSVGGSKESDICYSF